MPDLIEEERTGLRYQESWWQDLYVRETRTLLVFTSEDGSACYVEVPDAEASGPTGYFDDSIADAEAGISRECAVFELYEAGGLKVIRLEDPQLLPRCCDGSDSRVEGASAEPSRGEPRGQ